MSKKEDKKTEKEIKLTYLLIALAIIEIIDKLIEISLRFF